MSALLSVFYVTVGSVLLGANSVLSFGPKPMAACIPINTNLSGPLTPFFDWTVGGLAGLLRWVVIGVIVILIIAAAVGMRSDRATDTMKTMALIVLSVFAGILAIALLGAGFTALNNIC